jgi:cytochrome P450
VEEEAWKDIYSSYKTTGQLGKNYHHAAPDTIFSDPNHTTHAQKRKILSPGFSDKAMRDREEAVQSYVSLVMLGLRETPTGEQTDLLKWFDCLGIDVVSRLSFGESFHAL